MPIYDRIKKLAKLRGVSLVTVANETGVPVSTMKKWNKSDAYVGRLLCIAQYFDVSVDYLIGYTENLQSHKEPGSVTTKLFETLERLNHATHEAQELISDILVSSAEDKNQL